MPPGCATGGRAAVGVAAPGVPGCVIVRLIGAAAFGAVAVGGGAEKVFEPREPALDARPRIGIGDHHREHRGNRHAAKSGRKSFIRSLPERPVGAPGISGPGGAL